jgi:ATPase subunit of ABC transporter with duplicated ATPase domains
VAGESPLQRLSASTPRYRLVATSDSPAPELLLLDEPTNHFSPKLSGEL